MSQIGDRLSGLSQEQRVRLERLLMERRTAAAGGAIRRREVHRPCPVSFSQELMWLADQLISERSTYNITVALRLKGELNVTALQRALDTILERHEALRTNIRMQNDALAQWIAPSRPVEFNLIDAPAEDDLVRLCQEQARRPLDIANDLMLRAALIRLGPADHTLLLMTHHICFDGWSRKILFREIEALYSAYAQGKQNPLPPLPIQYADFACWQREWFEGDAMAHLRDYWKKQLSGAPTTLDLPTDRPRPAVQSFRGARHGTAALRSVMEPLKALRCGEGTTLYMSMLAAFNVLLYRYTGQDDILVGTPILGRQRPEVENLIGYFSNTLVLRTDLSGDPTFRELLARVRETVLGAFDHQEMPFEKLVMELQPERDPGRSPLFQVLFGAGDNPLRPPQLHGLEADMIKVDRGITKLDLTLGVTAAENQMMDGCEYSTDLFDHEAIVRTLGHFQVLLESIVADPDRRISELPILTEAERRQSLVEWNRTQTPFAKDASVHKLVEEQAARTPLASAVEHESRTMSYRELNARANQLAHYLRRRGAKPGTLVGLCATRSLDMTVGLLGVLKSGAACVPLDPGYPEDRLRFMIEDAQLPLLVAERGTAAALPASKAETILLDGDRETIGREPDDNPETSVAAEDIAFVIYTSGSTGQPKGVLLPHRGLVNHQQFATRLYGLGPGERMLQFSSISFDIALEEIFPAWVSGATVVLRPDDLLITGREFLDWLDSQRITALDLPTAYWHEWTNNLEQLGAPLPPDLRIVIVGGEKARTSSYRKWRAIAGDRVRWINTYGPAETSVIATAFEPAAVPDDDRTGLPVGRPIANTQIYLLDGRRQPVPIGVTGEIYIGGEGVARGYLNRPDLTAERFPPNPFGEGRLYRTGDLARYRADGAIEFAGRADHQVKIRGFRVEPEEIETTLKQCPGVGDALVLAREGDAGEKSLVAYVTPNGAQPRVPDLRAWVRQKLPEYMAPAAYVLLEALPLTPNGKVDRRALPAPDHVAEPDETFVAPRTPVEEMLAAMWSDLLKREPIGVHDNFFELGGHSLLAMQVVSRIREAFHIDFSLREIFGSPTVAGLGAKVFAALTAGREQETWSAA